jgi:hypothetical protein
VLILAIITIILTSRRLKDKKSKDGDDKPAKKLPDPLAMIISDTSKQTADPSDEANKQWIDKSPKAEIKISKSSIEDIIVAIDAIMNNDQVTTFASGINDLTIQKNTSI